MKGRFQAGITPQGKIINTANKFNNKGIKKQQGTTRVIYDTIQYDGTQTVFNFFEGVNSRSFPFTNLTRNQLDVGESMVIERAYLAVLIFDNSTDTLISFNTIAIDPILLSGEFEVQTANNRVVKPIPIGSMIPGFNKSSEFSEDYNYEFDTQITLQPLLEFNVPVRFPVPPIQQGDRTFLRLTLEGAGSILAPRATF